MDKQLLPTKTRIRFKQYMANKPNQFDIKFWLAFDVEFKYILNAIPYLGKDEAKPVTQRFSESVVIKKLDPYFSEGRNITIDNFLTILIKVRWLKKAGNAKLVNCEQNKTAKFCCGCRRSVCGKCTGCVKVECVDCDERC